MRKFMWAVGSLFAFVLGAAIVPAVASWDGTSMDGQFLTFTLGSKLLHSNTVPTVATGFGSAAAISNANGTSAFVLNTGTTAATSGVLTFPSASTGWNCDVIPTSGIQPYGTTYATNSGVNQVFVQNYVSGVATAWSANTIMNVNCAGR